MTGPRALLRLLGLLDAVAAAPGGLSLAELSQSLASPKSSLLALLRPLVTSGHLLHDGSRYRLGPTSYQFAEAILRGRQPSALIRAFLHEAWERSGETVILATIDREAAVATYVECLDSPQLVRYTVPAGSVRPLYCSAAGQALLAAQPAPWQALYLSQTKLKPLTPSTVTQLGRLRQRLEQIAADGVSISVSEAVPGAAGLAVPVVRIGGVVNEVILVAGPAERIRARLPELRDLVLSISHRLSAAMGHEQYPATVEMTPRAAGLAVEVRSY